MGVRCLVIEVPQSVDFLTICHCLEVFVELVEALAVDFYQLHASFKDGLFVSYQVRNVRLDVFFELIWSVQPFELLDLVPLLVFLSLVVKPVDLPKVKLFIEVIRVNESSLGVVLSVKFPSIDLGPTNSAAPSSYPAKASPH